MERERCGGAILLAQSGQRFGAAATLAWCLTLIPVLVGLWRMRNWARVLVICLQALGLVFSGFSLLTGDYEGGGWGALATLVESGIIIGWFATHREEFLPPPGSDEAASSPGLAVTALLAGLVSLVAWLAPFLGACVALAALVLGFASVTSARRRRKKHGGVP